MYDLRETPREMGVSDATLDQMIRNHEIIAGSKAPQPVIETSRNYLRALRHYRQLLIEALFIILIAVLPTQLWAATTVIATHDSNGNPVTAAVTKDGASLNVQDAYYGPVANQSYTINGVKGTQPIVNGDMAFTVTDPDLIKALHSGAAIIFHVGIKDTTTGKSAMATIAVSERNAAQR